ncbi:patatin-like protein 6 [Selaginella moellendorffii]|uniref:patatin-like protein 6 n=1 Tax=Selaginella moellendorffii TaxID=88036 RepID=UPI000D1C9C39|nr:patatin-like protein 6 [Selaginella moellendorffii]|eukprot:XP_024523145.1 patatin-like protein 6 [Selaginella moellendorffii]
MEDRSRNGVEQPVIGQDSNRKLRILSIDGGGMRGIIPAHMLAYLETALKEKSHNPDARIADFFDLAAGTSVGGLIAVMLFASSDCRDDQDEEISSSSSSSTGDHQNHGSKSLRRPLFTAAEVCTFISDRGKEIFKIPYPQRVFAKVRGIMTPRYSTKFFERILKQHLVRGGGDGRDLTLDDTLKPIVIPCYDLTNASAFCFSRISANFKLWEVCRATTAVPSFFKPIHVSSVDGKHEFTAVDGGLVVNNPTAAAITHALHDKARFPGVRGVEDMLVLSLGTGQFDQTYRYNKVERWGAFQWAKPIAKIIMDGISDMVDHTVSMAFSKHRENYVRIQMSGLPGKALLAMDDPSQANVKTLTEISTRLLDQKSSEHIPFNGRRVLEESNRQKLDWFAEQLVANTPS